MKRTDVVVGERYAAVSNGGVAKIGQPWNQEVEVLSANPEDTYKQYRSWSGSGSDRKPGVRVRFVKPDRNGEVVERVIPARSIAGLWSEERAIRAMQEEQAEAGRQARASNKERMTVVLAALKERGHAIEPIGYRMEKSYLEVNLSVLEDLLGIEREG